MNCANKRRTPKPESVQSWDAKKHILERTPEEWKLGEKHGWVPSHKLGQKPDSVKHCFPALLMIFPDGPTKSAGSRVQKCWLWH